MKFLYSRDENTNARRGRGKTFCAPTDRLGIRAQIAKKGISLLLFTNNGGAFAAQGELVLEEGSRVIVNCHSNITNDLLVNRANLNLRQRAGIMAWLPSGRPEGANVGQQNYNLIPVNGTTFCRWLFGRVTNLPVNLNSIDFFSCGLGLGDFVTDFRNALPDNVVVPQNKIRASRYVIHNEMGGEFTLRTRIAGADGDEAVNGFRLQAANARHNWAEYDNLLNGTIPVGYTDEGQNYFRLG